VDDAASMQLHWNKVIEVLYVLAYLLKDSADDGMALRSTSSNIEYKSKTSSGLSRHLRGRTLLRTSDIRWCLNTILSEYQTSLYVPTLDRRRPLSRKMKLKGKKPLSIYILIDAVWQPRSDPIEPITSLITMLKELGFSQNQVGIQFISFGNDLDGISKLEHLNSAIDLSWYVFSRRCNREI
jgi:hypothetical protein